LAGSVFESVDKDYPDLDDSRKIHEAVRRLIGAMVEDVLAESRRRIGDAKVVTAEAVRALGRPVVGFSEAMESQEKAVKKFLFGNMYRHEKVNVMTDKARNTVRDLFGFFRKQPEYLPSDWRRKLEGAGPEPTAQVVADYIAGMTDRFAIEEHRRHCDGGARTP
jgi:dGTPase